ncbi:amidohydrolase [Brevibacterium antiquum]|uniref:Aminobenzoyl-glutamate utilization protein A n=1 Tax=Brevibacterium antiquum TaxID=234835 RepID=A0A2H1KU79_9MICO|nr:amidohydrolase [Brevibacterium antiquum]SMY03208.1 aminobenzoyl-glutamate utilization protein A [Brevibacterium antiquum]
MTENSGFVVDRETHDKLVALRRDFHRYAETGWQEFRSASKIVTELLRLGWQVEYGPDVIDADTRMGVPDEGILSDAEDRAISQGADADLVAQMSGGFTGAVATWDTGKPGPTIGFRFDIDANDLHESTNDSHFPASEGFASINDGAMHGCGHDGHTSMGLVLAAVLAKRGEDFSGRVKLIFQPAEEGVRGAQSMVSAGVVDDVDIFIATHLGTGPELGEVVCGAKNHFATTKFDVDFTGQAAHAGVEPEAGRNALVAAATATVNLYAMTRHSGGDSRVNVGTLSAGEGRNVIARTAKLRVETRGRTSAVNEYLFDRAQKIVAGASTMYDVDATVTKVGEALGADPSAELCDFLHEQFSLVEGVETIHNTIGGGGSDDANTMITRVKDRGGLGAYMVIGTTLPSGHHTEKFDIDEISLDIGLATMVNAVINAGNFTITSQ